MDHHGNLGHMCRKKHIGSSVSITTAMLAFIYFLANIQIHCKIATHTLGTFMVMLTRNWENANGISNMLFYLEIWPAFPPDLHYPSSFQSLDQFGSSEMIEIYQIPNFYIRLAS